MTAQNWYLTKTGCGQRTMTTDNPNKFHTNIPREWIFTDRLQWGLYSILAELGAEFRPRPIMLDLLYAPGEARPEAGQERG